MRFSAVLVPVLAVVAHAAPVYPELGDEVVPRNLEAVSEYFNLLAKKVQISRSTGYEPTCDLSQARMPIAPIPLPPVSEGLSLLHVAVGRGTQNYTCDAGNATAVPQAGGAVASLFNVSCIAAAYPDLLNLIPRVSMQFDLAVAPLHAAPTQGAGRHRLGPSNAAFGGDHFFHDGKTPFFHLQEDGERIGDAYCSLNTSTPAPADAAVGQGGEPAVGWLKLVTEDGTTDDIQEVYRLTTVGGSAPKSCGDMPDTFEVQYAAVYWFYAGPAPPAPDDEEDE